MLNARSNLQIWNVRFKYSKCGKYYIDLQYLLGIYGDYKKCS